MKPPELETTRDSAKPTDVRIRNADISNDPQLGALAYQFGRYLLMCSSRPGTQAANLQGIWVDGVNAPWNSDYHVNINTQMNYWPAEVLNIAPTDVGSFTHPSLIARIMCRMNPNAWLTGFLGGDSCRLLRILPSRKS